MSLREILTDLKSFGQEIDVSVVEKYVFSLIPCDDQTNTSCQDTETLEECLEWTRKTLNNLHQGPASKQIVLLKLLFLLKLQKINSSQDEIYSGNLRSSIINNGCNLISLSFNHDCFSDIEYFIKETLHQIQNLEDGGKNSSLDLKKTFLELVRIENLIRNNQTRDVLGEMKKLIKNVEETRNLHDYFTGLCYNFGLKLESKNEFDEALECLLLPFALFPAEGPLSRNSLQVLYLLIQVCFQQRKESAKWSHAASALDLIKRNGVDMPYLFCKLRVSVASASVRLLEEALDEALGWDDIRPTDVKVIVEYLERHGRASRAMEFVWKLRHSRPFPAEVQFSLMQVELDIYLSQDDDRAFSLAENMLDAARQAPRPCAEKLYKALAAHGTKKFLDKQLKLSLQWYKMCAQLCEACGLDEKLKQCVGMRICLCYVEMDELRLAAEHFQRLKKSRLQGNPLYVYLALLVAFTSGDEALVDETLTGQAACCDKIDNILALCCQKAFASGKVSFAKKILETMTQCSNGGEPLLVAKVSRCLICLQNSTGWNGATEEYLKYLDKALDDLQKNADHLEAPELGRWFSRAAWNAAAAPGIEPAARFRLFLRCCCFSELGRPADPAHAQNALVLAAASGLEAVRGGRDDGPEREATLRQVMTLIDKCKSLETGSNATLLRLLYSYEFEARCHAEKGTRDGLDHLRRITLLPFVDSEMLQHVAGIAHKHFKNKHKVVTEALKLAAVKSSENDQTGTDVSKIYHSLIEVMFYTQEYCSNAAEEDTLHMCSNILKLIENKFKEYPELEVLWLMTKCWNWGIQKLTVNDTKRAHKWCTLAMAFLGKLGSLKALHEKRLSDMYATYFPSQV